MTMQEPLINRALAALAPGAIWTLQGDSYAGLIWQEPPGGQAKPSAAELEAKIAELAAAEG